MAGCGGGASKIIPRGTGVCGVILLGRGGGDAGGRSSRGEKSVSGVRTGGLFVWRFEWVDQYGYLSQTGYTEGVQDRLE